MEYLAFFQVGSRDYHFINLPYLAVLRCVLTSKLVNFFAFIPGNSPWLNVIIGGLNIKLKGNSSIIKVCPSFCFVSFFDLPPLEIQ